MIENLFNNKLIKKWNDHEGNGYIWANRFWSGNAVEKVDFIDFAIIPPNSSIGLHKHGDDNESYIILKGRGRMTCNGQSMDVNEGDIIRNSKFGEHSLDNNYGEDIFLLVVQVSER